MRTIMSLVILLGLPSAALAGQASTDLSVGVTVVAACPPGSGRPCHAPPSQGPTRALPGPAQVESTRPIAVVRDEDSRTITVIY